MREIKFCFEIFKETFRVAGVKQVQASLEGRAERSRRLGGSSHSLASLMKGFEFHPVEGGAVERSLLADS